MAGSSQNWFAVAVKPRHEKCVTGMLEHKGVSAWLPLQPRVHRYGPRTRISDIPLFPGYVFCQVPSGAHLPVLTTPGVLHFVGSGRVPVAVDDTEIDSIRAAVDRGADLYECPFLETGERVRIVAGPFAGVTGVVLNSRNPLRVRLSVTLLQRSFVLEAGSEELVVDARSED